MLDFPDVVVIAMVVVIVIIVVVTVAVFSPRELASGLFGKADNLTRGIRPCRRRHPRYATFDIVVVSQPVFSDFGKPARREDNVVHSGS